MAENAAHHDLLEIETIGRRLDKETSIDDNTLVRLKKDFSHLRFTLCSEDDTAEREPFEQYEKFDLHLLGAGSGCLGLTMDTSNYCGVVVALREEG
ncbi:hypothetical protein BCU68_11970 [Vibrio sp. 10N.286.49.B3]|uniref:DUF6129 family protein n=1 Tax=Vibrio sp. 10N.286.49.B3 TaxID=1880855 RepID=UPI000C8630FC|nr:DUF6129 family protein [Vibrio sp. 10N.286.49.B3]PMH44854.1 hypothetical protein BCU68_11970 [Vibrio sp. 10N.286.49.B3]